MEKAEMVEAQIGKQYFFCDDYIHSNYKCVKQWVARIIGRDNQYTVQREFLRRHGWERRRPFFAYTDMKKGDIVEINGGSWKNSYRYYGVYVGHGEIVEIELPSRASKVNKRNVDYLFAKAKEIRGQYNL